MNSYKRMENKWIIRRTLELEVSSNLDMSQTELFEEIEDKLLDMNDKHWKSIKFSCELVEQNSNE